MTDEQYTFFAPFSLPPRGIIDLRMYIFDSYNEDKKKGKTDAPNWLAKTIKENARTVVVPLNSVAQETVDRYADYPGGKLLPFESSERFNDNIKIIFEKAEVTYLVTELDTVTRTEKKVPINEIASSHMARRTFICNIYKLVKDPNLVSALTGHVEGSRAFSRYRTIDIDMKKDLVKILEGKQ